MHPAALAFLHEANLHAHTRIKSLLIENNLAWFKACREVFEACCQESVPVLAPGGNKKKTGDLPLGIEKIGADRFSSLVTENQLAFYREMQEIMQEWNQNLLAAIAGKIPSHPFTSPEPYHALKEEKTLRCGSECFNS